MIFAFLTRLGLPQRLLAPVAYVGSAVLAIALLWLVWALWLRSHDKQIVREHERKIAEQVERKSVEASHAATDAAHATKSDVEKRNDEARGAARDSDDPLGDALRSLRSAR